MYYSMLAYAPLVLSLVPFRVTLFHLVISSHGKNYKALAEVLENKTHQQIKNFFTNYKRKLNLPRRIAEYEICHVSLQSATQLFLLFPADFPC